MLTLFLTLFLTSILTYLVITSAPCARGICSYPWRGRPRPRPCLCSTDLRIQDWFTGAPFKPSFGLSGDLTLTFFFVITSALAREGSAVILGAGALARVNFLSSPQNPRFLPNYLIPR